MRFEKEKLMEKNLSALSAIALIENVETTDLKEITRDSLSDLILLMAHDGLQHVLGSPVPNSHALNQDTGVSLRIQRILDSQA